MPWRFRGLEGVGAFARNPDDQGPGHVEFVEECYEKSGLVLRRSIAVEWSAQGPRPGRCDYFDGFAEQRLAQVAPLVVSVGVTMEDEDRIARAPAWDFDDPPARS